MPSFPSNSITREYPPSRSSLGRSCVIHHLQVEAKSKLKLLQSNCHRLKMAGKTPTMAWRRRSRQTQKAARTNQTQSLRHKCLFVHYQTSSSAPPTSEELGAAGALHFVGCGTAKKTLTCASGTPCRSLGCNKIHVRGVA